LFSPSLILTFSLFSKEEEGDRRNQRKEKKEEGKNGRKRLKVAHVLLTVYFNRVN
jgi:hypothetical protein